MAQLLIRVDDELAMQVRRLVKEKYGGRRGALSLLVQDALRQALTPPTEISAAALLDVIEYVARSAKENRPKDEMLTNVFILLDREFEQTVVRGIQDLKHGRVRQVPRGTDALEFLRHVIASQR